jgi:uroporphyrinogen-III synthase
MEIHQVALKQRVDVANTLIFVSANAVRCGVDQLLALSVDLSDRQLFGMGPATASALKKKGLSSDLAESGFRSEDLLERLNSESVQLREVSLVCGHGGRAYLEQELEEMGAIVNRLEVYRRLPAENIEVALMDIDQNARPDIVSIMNQESLMLLDRAITKLNLEPWKDIPILVSSKRIQESARDLGFLQVFCQADPTESSLVDFLTQFSP